MGTSGHLELAGPSPRSNKQIGATGEVNLKMHTRISVAFRARQKWFAINWLGISSVERSSKQ